jgi:AAA+ ATPase superfamily predicted ATPase
MLALSGSQMGLMQRKVLAYDAPLYGRDTAQLKLPPMTFSATKQFFPEYSAADRVAIYTMWGGVPAYWERLDVRLSVIENLERQLMPFQSWMLDESRTLLQDFITEPHNYVAVLRAIADGLQSLSEISERAGLSGNHTSFYLSVLRDAGFVKREVPVSQLNMDSRRGRYFVTYPYLRFYYRFLAAYQSKLALGQQQQTVDAIEQALPEFIERNTWQELCREWVLEASANGELPVPVEFAGSEWRRNLMIDVVGLDTGNKSLVLGDCFWQDGPMGLEAVQELVRKTGAILPMADVSSPRSDAALGSSASSSKPIPNSSKEPALSSGSPGKGSTSGQEWSVYFTLFSAGGWTAEAKKEAEAVVEAAARRARKKWCPAGIRLIDLAALDADLARWANG